MTIHHDNGSVLYFHTLYLLRITQNPLYDNLPAACSTYIINFKFENLMRALWISTILNS